MARGGKKVGFHVIKTADAADVVEEDRPSRLWRAIGANSENPGQVVGFVIRGLETEGILRFLWQKVGMGLASLVEQVLDVGGQSTADPQALG